MPANATPAAAAPAQRDAVSLSWRSPFGEVLDPHNEAKTADAITLLFGVLGVATAAFQWTVSPWLLHIKIALAEWLVEHDHFALLSDDVPWWLLTHYPEANDLFTWLDGSLILAYLLLGGALIGSLLLIGTASASRLLRTPQLTWQRFSVALAPMAAASVILGLTMLTVTHLKAEHFWLGWLPYFRTTLLGPRLAGQRQPGPRSRRPRHHRPGPQADGQRRHVVAAQPDLLHLDSGLLRLVSAAIHAPSLRAGLVDLVGLLLTVLALLVAYKLTRPPPVIPVTDLPAATCDLQREACRLDLPGGASLELHIVGRPIRPNQPFVVEARSDDGALQPLDMALRGVEIEMASPAKAFQPDGHGNYRVETALPSAP